MFDAGENGVKWELMHCDGCGYEYLRERGRLMTLPCNTCKGRVYTVIQLVRGEKSRLEIPQEVV